MKHLNISCQLRNIGSPLLLVPDSVTRNLDFFYPTGRYETIPVLQAR